MNFPYFVVEKGVPSRPWNYTRQILVLAVAPLESSSLQMAVLRLSLLQNYFKCSCWVWAGREQGWLSSGCHSWGWYSHPHQRSQSCHPYPHLHILAPFLVYMGIWEREKPGRGVKLAGEYHREKTSLALWIWKRKLIYLKVHKTN